MDTLGTNAVWIIAALVDFAIKIAALIIIPRRRKPTAAMAWLLAIFLIPYVGILLYLLIGTFKLPRKRRDAQVRIDEVIRENVREERLEMMDPTWPRWFQRVVQQNEALTGIPASYGNQATLLGHYQASIDAMAEEIDTARTFVHVEFFIVAWDDTTRGFFSAMERAVGRGVTVRLLADHLPSAKIPGSKETFAELDRIGVKWSWMLPVQPFKGKYQRPDLRNHRKLVVVDGRVGFM
jgi:cardiolipin synthase